MSGRIDDTAVTIMEIGKKYGYVALCHPFYVKAILVLSSLRPWQLHRRQDEIRSKGYQGHLMENKQLKIAAPHGYRMVIGDDH